MGSLESVDAKVIPRTSNLNQIQDMLVESETADSGRGQLLYGDH